MFKMTRVYRYFSTSTGKKFVMALSGVTLVGFIVGHLVGNLQIFLGPDALNQYSAFLHSTGNLLWGARFGLIIMTILHIWTATAITLENRAARPQEYANKTYIEASYASRTMHLSGFIVLAYLIYHLMHFTFHSAHPQFSQFIDNQGRHDVYRMVVLSFQQPVISIIYIIANLLLGSHLSHGLYSMFQSLGMVRDSARPALQRVAVVVGYGIFIAYAAIPLSVWMGIVK
jgi:succinate dehydrogenase / fumarate reductase, cytochrome b subunit